MVAKMNMEREFRRVGVNRMSGVLRVTPKYRTCWGKAFGAIKRNGLLDRE